MRALVLLLVLPGCVLVPEVSDSPGRGAPSLDEVDRLVHSEAVAARRSNGAAGLDWSDALSEVAESHSRDMVRRGYFDHTDGRGQGAYERVEAAGVACRSVSENLYETTPHRQIRTRTVGGRTERRVDWWTPKEIAQRAVIGWLESPGHRRNLLRASSTRHGIGVAAAGERVVITQVLC